MARAAGIPPTSCTRPARSCAAAAVRLLSQRTQGPHAQGKNAAAVIDINGATPSYKKMPSMPKYLIWANATVLADGNVVVTGGSAVDNQLTGMNTSALLWKAGTGSWTQGAQSTPALRACTTPSLYSCPTARS